MTRWGAVEIQCGVRQREKQAGRQSERPERERGRDRARETGGERVLFS